MTSFWFRTGSILRAVGLKAWSDKALELHFQKNIRSFLDIQRK